MTAEEFYSSKYYRAIISAPFYLTEWIRYTEDEKDTAAKKTTGFYLKTYSYKEACAIWWEKMHESDREIIKSIPNFDADIFEEITGIEV